jgi:hypothetical protein
MTNTKVEKGSERTEEEPRGTKVKRTTTKGTAAKAAGKRTRKVNPKGTGSKLARVTVETKADEKASVAKKAEEPKVPPSAGNAPVPASPAKKEGLSKAEVNGLLACVSDLDRKLESSRKVLESLSAQLGALSRLGFNASCGPDGIVPRLVEIHNHLSNIHQALDESFESVRARYATLRDRCTRLTSDAAVGMQGRRKQFEELWKRIETARRKADLFMCLREENLLFSMALDDYNIVLEAAASMRDVDNRVNEVFNDFSETIGRIDGLSRAVSEFISEDDTRAFEEEEERMKKTRAERIGQYIR